MNLTDKLSDFHKKIIRKVLDYANTRNENVYIVGGVVRDLILDKEIKDIDFLIEGSAINFIQNSNFEIKSQHKDFDTIKVITDGTEFDFASTREEIYKNDGALPTVTKTGVGIIDDIKRRDFTVNSIAINLKTNELIDPYSGCLDIKNKILKVLHKNSFKDDPTRILRGLDFKYRFDFEFEDKTFELIKEVSKNFNNEYLSMDRLYSTLNKIFSYPYSNKILEDILKYQIYKIWLNKTELNPDKIKDLDLAAEIFEVKEKNKLYIEALESHFFVKAPLNSNFEIYQFFKKFNDVQLALYYFKTGDKNALIYLKLKNIKTFITGETLLNSGFKKGPFIGIILNSVLEEKINHPEKFKTIQDEINFVFENYSPD